ncbi:4a-hydroxytetrahydrobiopterin dehydratase [bacterium]|nr:4a-hydroxytetrahydrobiopterin dehydratase [bacterium]|tara:strand:- start:1146 stop:1445 length:300 start_codon:yes stop_codon:yes gene_type:complete
MKHAVLSLDQINANLKELPGWSVNGNQLEATYTFKTFADTMDFIQKVGVLAEQMNHHPEFCCSYTKVSFSFCTHDVGNQITDTDVEMAKKISELAKVQR